MGQVRHGSATTTHAVRAAIQRSQASLAELSKELGINPKTVAKWRKRATVEDMKTGPTEPRSTVLTEAKERLDASSDEEEQFVSFVHCSGSEEVYYYPLWQVEDREFEPELLDFPFLDWPKERIEALQNEVDQPSALELKVWQHEIARQRLLRAGDDYMYQAFIVPVEVSGKVSGYVTVDCGSIADVDNYPVIEGAFRTEREAWAALGQDRILERDAPR